MLNDDAPGLTAGGTAAAAAPRPAARQRLPRIVRVALALALVALGAAGGELAREVLRTERLDPFASRNVQRSLPTDVPLPDGLTLIEAGRGTRLPYRIVWSSPDAPEAVRMAYDTLLQSGEWHQLASEERRPHELVMLRGESNLADWVMKLSIAPEGEGSLVTAEFSPLPVPIIAGWRRQ